MRALLIRQDKIGDLIATLPVDQTKELATHEIEWLVSDPLAGLMELTLPPRKFATLPIKFSWQNLKNLVHSIKEKKPDLVVIFYAQWWIYFACFVARVPTRWGRYSQWYSFLFLNKGLRQKRSLSEKHEFNYNQDLLEAAFGQQSLVQQTLTLAAPALRHLFEKYQISSQKYYVIHPGMAGSALNWPPERYSELIGKLVESSLVVVTGTQLDKKYLDPLRAHWQMHPQVRWLEDQLGFRELLFILKNAKAVVAPSTGVLHLAAALGTQTIGIFSPILAHHPRRWGPRGEKATFLLPSVECPAQSKCLGEKCFEFSCMKKITAEHLTQELIK